MAKPSKMQEFDSPDITNRVVIQKPETVFVKLASSIDARIKVNGKYSGREYLFERAGSTQDVDQRDAEWMLSMRQGGRQCCGGSETGNKVFVLA